MIRRFVLILIFSLACWVTEAQTFNQRIYQYYVSGDFDHWEEALNTIVASDIGESDQYDLGMAYYGFIGYCLGNGQKSRARPYLDKLDELTNALITKNPDEPRILALQGALYGLRMSLQPQKMLSLGPKASKSLSLAIEKGPLCPQSWIEYGNMDWHMPAVFGGSKVNAMADYQKAIRLMEKDPEFANCNWYYLNAHRVLAGWYEESGQTYAAGQIYRKMVLAEPGLQWARDKLKK